MCLLFFYRLVTQACLRNCKFQFSFWKSVKICLALKILVLFCNYSNKIIIASYFLQNKKSLLVHPYKYNLFLRVLVSRQRNTWKCLVAISIKQWKQAGTSGCSYAGVVIASVTRSDTEYRH